MSLDTELESSELGTKEYWDDAYSTEIKNFKDFGDVGEVWFGSGCSSRIIQWLNTNVAQKDESVIDLGCGNGMLLIELAKDGWSELTGVDYSQNAIKLAKGIATTERFRINYLVWDILSDEDVCKSKNFDIALDKGTYDAISLSPGDRSKCRQKYANSIKRILKKDGIFIITSCNWTEEELKEYFCFAGFEAITTIPAPKLTFGGSSGNRVATVVFKKK